MELRHYARALVRYWFVSVAFVAMSIAAVGLYQRTYGGHEYEATVAVLDPLVARPTTYGEAQLGFDAVIRSRQLAERVATRLDVAVDEVEGRISVALLSSLSPATSVSPLFAVRGKDADDGRARRLTDLATEEARLLFIDLNTPDPTVIRRSFDAQRAQLTADAARAREAFHAFTADKDAVDLPARIAQQRELIGSLRLVLAQSRADEAVARVYGGFGEISRKNTALEETIRTEQKRVSDLLALEPRYTELLGASEAAQGRLAQLEQAEQGLIIGQRLPLAAQVKILDLARPRSQVVWIALTYAVGVLLGVFAGLTAVYAFALARREPPTAEDVALAFGAPVLVRISGKGAVAGR